MNKYINKLLGLTLLLSAQQKWFEDDNSYPQKT